MLLKNFIDREKELKTLEARNIVLIYGRRRIGKTALIKEYIKDKKAFYFLAQQAKLESEFNRFLYKFNKTFNMFVDAKGFEEFFEKIKDMNIIVVIDEFSYLVEKNPSISSIFQYIIDEILINSNLKLIISGSLIGIMESLLSYKNPLYGRIKTRMKIGPLKFKYIKTFLPSYSLEDLVKVYACVGGVPAYLEMFKDNLSLEKNVENLFFNKYSFLYDDAERILKDELREPNIYFRILKAISQGETTLGSIANKAFVNITNLPKYLHVLEKMDLIKREHPIIGKARPLIKIKDNYFNFWSSFVYTQLEEIEIGTAYLDSLKFNQYISYVFEDIVKEVLFDLKPINFTRIGKWWYKDKEIDIVAVNEQTKEMLAVEVKWKTLKLRDVKQIIEELRETLPYVNWHNDKRKEVLGIFAKKVEKKAKKWLISQGYKVWDLGDIEKIMEKRKKKKTKGIT